MTKDGKPLRKGEVDPSSTDAKQRWVHHGVNLAHVHGIKCCCERVARARDSPAPVRARASPPARACRPWHFLRVLCMRLAMTLISVAQRKLHAGLPWLKANQWRWRRCIHTGTCIVMRMCVERTSAASHPFSRGFIVSPIRNECKCMGDWRTPFGLRDINLPLMAPRSASAQRAGSEVCTVLKCTKTIMDHGERPHFNSTRPWPRPWANRTCLVTTRRCRRLVPSNCAGGCASPPPHAVCAGRHVSRLPHERAV